MTTIHLHPDARAFLARAGEWLQRSEMENAMALQSARFASRSDVRFPLPPYWATVEEADEIVGCAFCTPPFRLGLTALPLDAIPALVDSVRGFYRTLSGVAGPEPAVSAYASKWIELHGGGWRVQSRQRLLAHRAIVPTTADPPKGTLRLATPSELPVAREWGAAFAAESGLAALDAGVCAELCAIGQLYVWDDGGPRCMLGVLRETRKGAAIGILYTPPQLRDRGYATAAVAAFSRGLLERGIEQSYFCLDPENPIADWVCRRLGYGPVQDTADIDFVPV